jgi:hypothetical protein
MTLEELLHSLGYDGSPCFLKRGDGVFETEMGYGHIFRRAKESQAPQATTPPRWQAEGVYGIRESAHPTGRFTPIVYVCSAKDDAAADLHRLLWNQDVAPYIIVYTIRGVRVYSGFNYAPEAKKAKDQGVLAALTDFENVKSIIEQFSRREIDEGRLWQQPNLRVDPSQRVYHRLLASLRELDKSLQLDGLSKEVSHALIGKYVYLRYLRDRGILSDERLGVWNLKADDIFGSNAKKRSLSILAERLDEWLNGEVFPLPWSGKQAPSAVQVRAVAGAFRGDECSADGTQAQLFDPYDFSFIPIETLSLVYEQFLHSEDLSAEVGNKTKKTKGRQEGAYYTPLPLVNFMLASMERQHPLRRGMKVLDPSCGSGSFLVQAYRLLIENTYPYSKQRPKPGQLRDLLEESIFGCDVDGDACQVTQLSLLLTLLDYVDPPDLRGSMHAFKLPTLCETKDEKKRAAGHTPNILKHNFFGIEPLLSAAAVGKQDAVADWKTQGFDWIVGNPPWKNISPKKLGENDAPVWDWMKANAKSMPVGDNQAAQAFAWELGRYLRDDGECALLVPAMGLFDEPSSEFRSTFFTAFQVYEVANFANLAEVLFDGRARVPTAAISYRKRVEDVIPDSDELIAVFSPFVVNQEATRPLKEGKRGKIWSLSVNSSEVRSLDQREVLSGSGLPWKLAMWGSAWDERLLQKLEKKWPRFGAMEARWDRKTEKFTSDCASQIIGVSQGLELRERPEKNDESKEWPEGGEPKPIEEVSGAKKLNTNALVRWRNIFAFPESAILTLEERDWYGRQGRVSLPLAVCRGPHVVLSAARKYAVYLKGFMVLPQREIGIISLSKDRDLLKALSLFLSSDFVFYHQFFRSSEFGISRDRATLEALRKMPAPIASLTRDELKEWTALHAKLAKCKPRKLADLKKKTDSAQSDLFESTESDLDELLEKLNQMTADVLGLSSEERSLIHDFVQVRYALNDGKRGYAAMRPPEQKELLGYAKTLKGELDDFTGDFAGRSHQVTVVADAESAMIEIDFTKDHERARNPMILSADTKEARALRRTRERLLEDEGAWQWAYFNRNLRIYRGRKTYLFKPLNRFHWTQSVALTDASQVIAETLSGS